MESYVLHFSLQYYLHFLWNDAIGPSKIKRAAWITQVVQFFTFKVQHFQQIEVLLP